MVKILIKTIKITLVILLVLIISLIILFYRRDLPLNVIEEKYFTDNSYYINLTITTEQNQEKSIKIHYQDYGQTYQKVIVLLHGAFSSSHTFEDTKDLLIDNEYRVIMIDLPYHGLSDGFEDHVTSINRSARVVKSLLDELEIDEIYIAGNSMGGGVSYNLAGLYNGNDGFIIKGIIFIDSIFPFENFQTGGPRRVIQLLSSDFTAPLISKLTPRFLLKYILEGVYGDKELLKDETVDRYYEILRKTNNRLSILKNTQETLDYEDQIAFIDKIKEEEIPVLVLWGKKDTWISYEVAYLFQERLDLTNEFIVIYDDLGHVPMEENPDLVFLDIINFLSNNP
jgi:pimeloyl-ACP methyl ester carboxylesterase